MPSEATKSTVWQLCTGEKNISQGDLACPTFPISYSLDNKIYSITLENSKCRLPKEHQRLLRKHGYQETMDDIKEAVDQNHGMISKIMADVEEMFENVTHQVKEESDPRVRPSQLDMDKVQSTLKQLVRDWSSAGAVEREQCYTPIIKVGGRIQLRCYSWFVRPGSDCPLP